MDSSVERTSLFSGGLTKFLTPLTHQQRLGCPFTAFCEAFFTALFTAFLAANCSNLIQVR